MRRRVLVACAAAALALPAAASANTAPTAAITSPADGHKYPGCTNPRESFNTFVDGSVGDAEDASLTYTWDVDVVHGAHEHESVGAHFSYIGDNVDGVPQTGSGASRIGFNGCHAAPHVYRVTLTATDSAGLTATDTLEIAPSTLQVTVNANVAGAQLTYDGRPIPNPYVHDETWRYGIQATASERVESGGVTYAFGDWRINQATGASPSRTLVVGVDGTTFTAYYFPMTTVEATGGVLRVKDPSTWSNQLVVRTDGGDLLVTDTVQLDAGAGCTQETARAVRCPATAASSIDVQGGGGRNAIENRTALPSVITSGPGEDTLIGGSGPDTISGATNTDTIRGGEGNDTLKGGSESDFILGEGGDDTLLGEGGPDGLDGGTGTNTLDGGADNDRLRAAPGATDTFAGGDGFDAVTYASHTTSVTLRLDAARNDGSAGEDLIGTDVEEMAGGSGNDMLFLVRSGHADGGGGNDYLEPSRGGDSIRGGSGFDRVSYHVRTAPLLLRHTLSAGEDSENDSIEPDVEHLRGGEGPDHFYPTPGITGQILEGRGGDDTFHPGSTILTRMIGGLGLDTVTYQERTSPVRVTIGSTALDDGPAGSGQQVGDDVEGIVGGSGDDTLVGSQWNNPISGGGGNDYLEGRTGRDDLRGGTGTDRVSYQFHPQLVKVTLDETGNDGAAGESDNVRDDVEIVRGTAFADLLIGNGGAQRFEGLGGGDDLRMGLGSDVADGGEGNDRIDVNDGVADTAVCGNGADTLTRDSSDTFDAGCETVNPLAGAS
jgi:Ca2+-binding RTX toxin-like protein